MEKIIAQIPLHGFVQIPPSKSDAQRALIAALLAKGQSSIYNFGSSDDERNLLKLIQKMGAIIVNQEGKIELFGAPKLQFSGSYTIGESGLALRILTSVFALNANNVSIKGTGTLRKRSMDFFDKVLPLFGVSFQSSEGFLPFHLDGKLKGGNVVIDGSQSSQYISGLLIALPLVEGTSRLTVENLTSKPYIQMTMNTLQKFGVVIETKDFKEFIIPGNQHYLSNDYTIESDWSSASCWLVAAALGAEIKVQGLSMSSLQADKKILNALMTANCNVRFELDGIMVDGTERKAFSFDANHCPDLFPALVTLAAFTEGETRIAGANRLKNKESDRAKVLMKEFGKLGVKISQLEDELIIQGQKNVNGGIVDSHHDHRIAMCMAITGLFTEEKVTIKNADAVSKSYPNFWEHLEQLQK